MVLIPLGGTMRGEERNWKLEPTSTVHVDAWVSHCYGGDTGRKWK